MKEERVEGIVLKSLEYKERHRIITLFTLEAGIMSLIVKGLGLTSPFCQAEYLYLKGKSDLYRFQDGTLVDAHLELRNELKTLQAAGEMAQAVLRSQMPGKPAPQLYSLLISCLKQLPSFADPSSLIAAFHLKLLSHEGVIAWEESSQIPVFLSQPEWISLKELASCRSFEKLRQLTVSKDLNTKIQNISALLTR